MSSQIGNLAAIASKLPVGSPMVDLLRWSGRTLKWIKEPNKTQTELALKVLLTPIALASTALSGIPLAVLSYLAPSSINAERTFSNAGLLNVGIPQLFYQNQVHNPRFRAAYNMISEPALSTSLMNVDHDSTRITRVWERLKHHFHNRAEPELEAVVREMIHTHSYEHLPELSRALDLYGQISISLRKASETESRVNIAAGKDALYLYFNHEFRKNA